jgi:excisionase family DNA binding protein
VNTTTEAPPEWLTLIQAAREINKSRSPLDRAVRRGELPFAVVGGTRLFNRADVQAYGEREANR